MHPQLSPTQKPTSLQPFLNCDWVAFTLGNALGVALSLSAGAGVNLVTPVDDTQPNFGLGPYTNATLRVQFVTITQVNGVAQQVNIILPAEGVQYAAVVADVMGANVGAITNVAYNMGSTIATTISAAAIKSQFISLGASNGTAATIATTDTAANIVAAFFQPVANTHFHLHIWNTSGETVTFAGGSGVTVHRAANATLATGLGASWMVVLTNVTSGNQAVDMYPA